MASGTMEGQVETVPSTSPSGAFHLMPQALLDLLWMPIIFWIMKTLIINPMFIDKGNAEPLPRWCKREGNTQQEYFTTFETQVLTNLLMVTGMSEVKDTVSCELHLFQKQSWASLFPLQQKSPGGS